MGPFANLCPLFKCINLYINLWVDNYESDVLKILSYLIYMLYNKTKIIIIGFSISLHPTNEETRIIKYLNLFHIPFLCKFNQDFEGNNST